MTKIRNNSITKNVENPAGNAGNIALTASMSDQLASLVGLDLFVTFALNEVKKYSWGVAAMAKSKKKNHPKL